MIMITLYLVTGLTVSLVLFFYSEYREKDSKLALDLKEYKYLASAIVLTTLFWPFVILMSYFNVPLSEHPHRSLVKTKDLIQKTNVNTIEESINSKNSSNKEFSIRSRNLNSKWQTLKSKSRQSNSVWTFKTEYVSANQRKTLEGYALVDQNKNVVDYLIMEKHLDVLHHNQFNH